MNSAELSGSAEDQSWKSPRLRAQEKWIARIGIALLVALAAGIVVAWMEFRTLGTEGPSWTVTDHPVTLGPEWQTFQPAEPMNSAKDGIVWHSVLVTLARGYYRTADNSSIRDPHGEAIELPSAEIVLVDGTVIPAECCESYRTAGPSLVIDLHVAYVDDSKRKIPVRAVRLRSLSALRVDSVRWVSYYDAL